MISFLINNTNYIIFLFIFFTFLFFFSYFVNININIFLKILNITGCLSCISEVNFFYIIIVNLCHNLIFIPDNNEGGLDSTLGIITIIVGLAWKIQLCYT